MTKSFKSLLALLLTITAIAVSSTSDFPDDVDQAWELYKVKFGNDWRMDLYDKDAATLQLRKDIFTETHKMIVEHNNNGDKAFTLEHNIFSIMTEKEKQDYFGFVSPPATGGRYRDHRKSRSVDGLTLFFGLLAVSTLAKIVTPYYPELDYRDNACMGPVKDQGACGSCYAFAAVASLESSNCLLNENKYTSFSEQQIVDCDMSSNGCDGGWPHKVWKYIKETNGIAPTSSYPYVSGSTRNRKTCQFNANMVAGNVESYGQLPSKDPNGMIAALVKYGVLVVSISTSGNFQNYKSGVYTDQSCDVYRPNHAVNIVGYGKDSASGLDYWIVRNSWGSDWGQGGYMLLQRGVNKCDVESNVGYVVAVQKNVVTDVDNKLRYLEAQYGTMNVVFLSYKIFKELSASHPEYRWLVVVSPSEPDVRVFRSVTNPPQVFVHWNTFGNKDVLAFRHKTAQTNNPDVGSATFGNSIRDAFNQAQAKYRKAKEVLDEAKRIYSPIGNYQQVVIKTNRYVGTFQSAGFSFYERQIGDYYVMLIELPTP